MDRVKVSCPFCKKEITKEKLEPHMRIDPEDRFNKYVCVECGKDFPNKRCFTYHQTTHQIRDFICDIENCGRAFTALALLRAHQKRHVTTKTQICPFEGCDKSFHKLSILKKHIRIAHEKYRKKCPVGDCPYETGIFKDMRDHIVRHREIKLELRDSIILNLRELNLL